MLNDNEYYLRKANIVRDWAVKKHNRAQALFAREAISEEEFEQARLELALANLEVERYTPRRNDMAWKKGPLLPNTWNWGGVVPLGEEKGGGFYFADFKGDTVEVVGDTPRVLKVNEVAYYNNCLELPPSCDAKTGKRL